MNLKITDLLDEYMGGGIPVDPVSVLDLQRIKEAAMKKTEQGHKHIRPLRIVLIAAAITVLLTGTVLGVMHYTKVTDSLEERWEILGSEEMTREQKDYVEERSISVGESVTDQGVTVTVDSVTCTANTVYMLYTIVLDSAVHDVDGIPGLSAFDSASKMLAENPEFGAVELDGGGGPSNGGNSKWERWMKFADLPEEANLGDGDTTLHVEITEITYGEENEYGMKEASGTIQGNWRFAIKLPKHETAEVKAPDAMVEFGNSVLMTISDIELNETECTFSVDTESEAYLFVGGDGTQAQLAREAEPDMLIIAMYANVPDGNIAYGAAIMEPEPGEGVDRWTVQWAAPIDPERIISLTFSDGTTEMEVPLSK